MNATRTPQAYRQSAILSATPGQLVVMQYDGVLRFLRQATMAMRAGDIERTHKTLRRAELIIAHLNGTLDDSYGEIPRQLHEIYGFCLRHLNAGRMALEPGKLEEVGELLGELREAWAQAAVSTSS